MKVDKDKLMTGLKKCVLDSIDCFGCPYTIDAVDCREDLIRDALAYINETDGIDMTKTHDLKIRPEYFAAVRDGTKTFELRKDDRGFNVGDILHLREYRHDEYTGRHLYTTVTYILRDAKEYGLEDGYCILGLGKVICK